MTGALEDSDTFREDAFLERKALAPSAYFRLSDDLEINLGASYLYDKRLIDFGIPALNGRQTISNWFCKIRKAYIASRCS